MIVKLGGSVITDKRRKFVVRRGVLRRLARELGAANCPLVIVHGGGSFGHPLASKYGLAKGFRGVEQLIGFALTHRAMERLNAHVVDALHRAKIPAVSVQPSACVVVEDGRIKSAELTPLRKLLELGLVPVLYGDVVPDMGKGMSILSGDQLVAKLSRELGVKRVILGVDVNGVYTVDPKIDKKAVLIEEINPSRWSSIEKRSKRGAEVDVTGGMANKVRELLKLVGFGVEAEIVNAMRPGTLERAISGERGLGTRVVVGSTTHE